MLLGLAATDRLRALPSGVGEDEGLEIGKDGGGGACTFVALDSLPIQCTVRFWRFVVNAFRLLSPSCGVISCNGHQSGSKAEEK